MLVPGKGWVLAVLTMLAPKRALRVAARGCGPGFAALALHCTPVRGRGVGTEGVPPFRPVAASSRPGSNERLLDGSALAGSASLAALEARKPTVWEVGIEGKTAKGAQAGS